MNLPTRNNPGGLFSPPLCTSLRFRRLSSLRSINYLPSLFTRLVTTLKHPQFIFKSSPGQPLYPRPSTLCTIFAFNLSRVVQAKDFQSRSWMQLHLVNSVVPMARDCASFNLPRTPRLTLCVTDDVLTTVRVPLSISPIQFYNRAIAVCTNTDSHVD